MKLDQATPDHTAATDNLKLLEDPEVAARLAETDGHEIHVRQLQYQAFFTFHVSQVAATERNLSAPRLAETAVAFIKQELGYIEMYRTENPNANKAEIDAFVQEECYMLWYMQATAAYLRGNEEGVGNALQQLQTIPVGHGLEGNTKIVERLLTGLQERGAPDYVEDYK